MILALSEHPRGVADAPGTRVVYDLERNEAHFGSWASEGPAVVWELAATATSGAVLAAELELDPAQSWIVRCDRIDFPPGGVAYRHTHPGPGIRRLLFGSIRIDAGGQSRSYGPGGAWFESGPEPVYAAASAAEPTAFVRVLLLPAEWAGKRSIRYLDPRDDERPKLQRATVFFDQALET